MAESIVSPVDRKILLEELSPDKFIRKTNNAGNEIYVVTAFNAPNVMREIGRLREISFRTAGGGSGKSMDIDHYDVAENPYKQLIIWDPDNQEILGGYRYHLCDSSFVDEKGEINLATAELFRFSDLCIREYLPFSIELGRSFVQPEYQSTGGSRKSIFALDNLWDGLGALMVQNSDKKYFIGKVTMYPSYNREARDLILHFLSFHFGDKEGLLEPFHPIFPAVEPNIQKIFSGKNYKENYKILSQKVRKLGVNIPPLISSYMNISPTMRTFGTSINEEFGTVEETGIMITIADLYPEKLARHLTTYDPNISFK